MLGQDVNSDLEVPVSEPVPTRPAQTAVDGRFLPAGKGVGCGLMWIQ